MLSKQSPAPLSRTKDNQSGLICFLLDRLIGRWSSKVVANREDKHERQLWTSIQNIIITGFDWAKSIKRSTQFASAEPVQDRNRSTSWVGVPGLGQVRPPCVDEAWTDKTWLLSGKGKNLVQFALVLKREKISLEDTLKTLRKGGTGGRQRVETFLTTGQARQRVLMMVKVNTKRRLV